MLNAGKQNLRGTLGEQRGVLADGRQPRHGEPPQRNTVVPGHADILRHPQTVILEGAHGPQRHQIRHGKHSVQIGAVGQQVLRRRVALLHGKAGVTVLLVKIKGQAKLLHGLQTAVQTLLARAAAIGPVANDADAAAALLVHMLDHDLCGGVVVHADAGQVRDAQARCIVRQQHAGDAQPGQLRREAVRVRADEKDAVGLALGAEHLGVGHLVAGLVDVVDRGRVAARFNICLQFVQQIRKQGVLGALYHQGKAFVGLLLQVLGVGIGLVAVLRHHGKDLFPCLGADAGVMVQHAGDGPHRVARLAGDILNGQKGLPSFLNPPLPRPARTPAGGSGGRRFRRCR